MVSAYAEDIDHINVFGEWQKGRATVRDDLARLHAGPLRNSQKTHRIEKVRFLKPDVVVVQVSSHSINGDNIGTFVMEKQKGTWLTVSFTNVAPQDPPLEEVPPQVQVEEHEPRPDDDSAFPPVGCAVGVGCAADAAQRSAADWILSRHIRHAGPADRDGTQTRRYPGYDGVELALMPEWQCDPAKMSTADGERLRALLRETRLALPAMNDVLFITADSRGRNLERLRLAADLAHYLVPKSPPVIETTLGGKIADWPGSRDMIAEELRSWTHLAKQHDVTLCFKPHAGQAIHNSGRALRRADDPNR